MKDAPARAAVCSLNDIDGKDLVRAEQVHGNIAAAAGIENGGTCLKGADGLVTSGKNTAVAIFTADCLPVFFGVKGKACGIAHAGWRGLQNGIIPSTAALFEAAFGCAAREISASIGPHICAGCYAIGEEIRKAFRLKAGETNFDLAGEAVAQLKKAGIEKINVSGSCTCHETELFFSYRKNKIPARIMSLTVFSNNSHML